MDSHVIRAVDRVEVTVLQDDYAGYGNWLLAQDGLSLWIRVTVGATVKTILFDTGKSADPILHNMGLLGIDPGMVDLIALSHCHRDHTGGLVGILKTIRKDIPVLAHPGLFRPHFMDGSQIDPEFWLMKPIGLVGDNTQQNIERWGGRLMLLATPAELMPGVLWSGEIPRVTDFEASVTLPVHTIDRGKLAEDQLMDDCALAVNVKGRGLVVLAGCSHAGIVNTVKQAIAASGVDRVLAVAGGFHLLDADDDRIAKTAGALTQLGVEKVFAGHCTGFKGEMAIFDAFRDNFEKLHCGKVMCFDSA